MTDCLKMKLPNSLIFPSNKGDEGCEEMWACCKKPVENEGCGWRYTCCQMDMGKFFPSRGLQQSSGRIPKPSGFFSQNSWSRMLLLKSLYLLSDGYG